ncbi:DUF3556 domain-containing protein [Streptomyces sp. NPDC004549]|uniref:DUF3556 domain-containing protein n=1 Tax=Streptomyces sp. NPDC004549 TaxID=3154283 RepID=UPI0033B4C220
MMSNAPLMPRRLRPLFYRDHPRDLRPARLTRAALLYMAVPMGVPLEWNLFFVFSLFHLFGAHGDITVRHLHSPWLLAVLLPTLVLLPLLGNLRPDLVSFLPAMRYYAGNWATSAWVFTGDALDRLETCLQGGRLAVPALPRACSRRARRPSHRGLELRRGAPGRRPVAARRPGPLRVRAR